MNEVLFISTLVALSVGTLWYGLYRRRWEKQPLVERLEGHGLSLQRTEEMELSESFSTRVLKPFLRRLLAAAGRLTPAGNIERLQHDLFIAGHPANLTLLDFLGIKLLCAIGTGALVFAVLLARKMSGLPALLFAAAAALIDRRRVQCLPQPGQLAQPLIVIQHRLRCGSQNGHL